MEYSIVSTKPDGESLTTHVPSWEAAWDEIMMVVTLVGMSGVDDPSDQVNYNDHHMLIKFTKQGIPFGQLQVIPKGLHYYA